MKPTDPAATSPPSAPDASAARPCEAPTKAGGSCPNRAAPGSRLCALHTPGDERRALLSARGKSGRAKRAAREREGKAAAGGAVNLRDAADLRAALERALRRVEEGGESATAAAVARICSAALAVIRAVEHDADTRDLRELLRQPL